jgi:amino acid adenylation domain-containing protein
VSIDSLLDQLSAQGVELWFEGARLRFRAPRGALTADQRAQLLERRDELLATLRQRAARGHRVAPLSYGQYSLWFVHQQDPDSAAYHVAFAARVESEVDFGALQHAVQALVDRHASLRTTYDVVDGRPSQRIAGTATARIEVVDLPGVNDVTLRSRIESDYRKPFDLRHDVFRSALYSRGPADHVLLINAHHIAIDGWSLFVLLDEFRALYVEAVAGTPASLPRIEVQYTDYVEWQQRMLAGAEGERLAAYWQTKLAAPRAEVELVPDRPRPPRKSVRGATCEFLIDATITRRLAEVAREQGTTLFVLLLAAFKILLFRYTGTNDIVIGVPMRGRSKPEFERVLGYFVNPVPLRSRLCAQTTVSELISALRHTMMEALEGQEYPFALMVERLQPRRDPSRSPLFETTFTFQHFEQFGELSRVPTGGVDAPPTDFGGLQVRPYPLRQAEGQFDLGLSLMDRADGRLDGAVSYNTDLFDGPTIERLASNFHTLLSSMVANDSEAVGDRPISALSMLSRAARAQLLKEFNATDRAIEPAGLVTSFERQVARTPEATALSFEGDFLTYAALNARANRLAHHLRSLGVGPGVLVAVCVHRSPSLLIALLAIQKAGGAYVPLDPSFPQERLAYIAEDSAAAVLVTAGDAAAGLDLPASVKTVDLDRDAELLSRLPVDNLAQEWRPDDPAYVIYTSGSTGRPKGVVVPQGALANFLAAMESAPGLSSGDILAAVTTISFDIAGLELYLPLVVGARIELVPAEIAADGHDLLAHLTACGANVLQATPVTWRLLIEAGWRGGPQFRAFCGGEALPRDLADQLLDRVGELWNLYGPTETTIWSTVDRVEKGSDISIGRPIANTQIYVVDPSGGPVPIGVPGEIWIGGAGVALGYHRRPELTAERFVTDPFRPGEGRRVYRTGDLGRWRADGRLEHLGRLDHQVKVRGFRIELGEIEAVLASHAAVRQAVAVASEVAPGLSRLVAYVVYRPGEDLTVSDVRRFLRRQLPEYMVPSIVISIDAVPLTPNGKVDRAQLPDPFKNAEPAVSAFEPPLGEMEEAMAAIWRDVLKVDRVGANDNFFELGGYSLLSLRVVAAVEKQLGWRMDPRTLFFQTLRTIAAAAVPASPTRRA